MTSQAVVWSQGLFVKPQHFQQQNKHFFAEMIAQAKRSMAYYWGFSSLELDQGLLEIGKISIARAEGVFPDGTAFKLPEVDGAALTINVSGDENFLIWLILPITREGALEIEESDEESRSSRFFIRYSAVSSQLDDSTGSCDIAFTRLRAKLVAGREPPAGYVGLPVCRVKSVLADGRALLDETYVPPSLNLSNQPSLKSCTANVHALLSARAGQLNQRYKGRHPNTSASMARLAHLQVLRKYEAELGQLLDLPVAFPWEAFSRLVALEAELGVFSEKFQSRQRSYAHDDPGRVFQETELSIKQLLSESVMSNVQALRLEESRPGWYLCQLAGQSGKKVDVVLAVRARMAEAGLKQAMLTRAKVGSPATIRDLVNLQLPGVPLEPLTSLPHEVPYQTGTLYFRLQHDDKYWPEIIRERVFALHIAGELPSLELEAWVHCEHEGGTYDPLAQPELT